MEASDEMSPSWFVVSGRGEGERTLSGGNWGDGDGVSKSEGEDADTSSDTPSSSDWFCWESARKRVYRPEKAARRSWASMDRCSDGSQLEDVLNNDTRLRSVARDQLGWR